MIPLIQSRTFEHYSVLTDPSGQPIILSSDGSGATYRARDSRNDQPVILRVFSEKLLADCSVQTDFVKNARMLIELDHPSITRIVDTGQSDNQFFYVLQDPGGSSVHELVERDGPLDVSKTLRLHGQLSEALIGLRTQPGLLSRVWPRNLIVTSGEPPSVFLVAQNLITPTPPIEHAEFLAPEILAGHGETAQSTLYSIGATLYYMLTGRPPFPAMENEEALLEVKSTQRVDCSALPTGAPVMLIKHLLEPEARNRPKSLMEWDRALQRFIRFTPESGSDLAGIEETASVAAKPARPARPAQEQQPQQQPQPQPVHRFVAANESGSNDEQIETELRKAKVHTQRLSLELTKRVQKELALTEQLKNLEGELERERQMVNELRQNTAAKEKKQKPWDVSDLEAQWETLRKARKDLDREKHEFLKKTQRFSLQQLKTEAARMPALTSKEAETPLVKKRAHKPRLFRFHKRTPKPEDKGPEQTVGTKPVEGRSAVAKPEANPPASPPTEKSSHLKSSEPVVAKPPAASDKAVAQVVTPFSVPKSATTATSRTQEKVVRPTAKPTPPAKLPTEEVDPKVVTFATPFSKADKARSGTQPMIRTPKPSITAAVPKEQSEVFERAVAATVSDQETTKIAALPDMEPMRGAWGALSVLGLVIGIGLFMVYRTFYSGDHAGRGQADGAPIVVDYWPDEPNGTSPIVEASVSNPVVDPSVDSNDLAGVEDKLNEEIRVEMRVFENFLLLQDQEWAELLHGLKNLERQADKYTPAELNQVRSELLEDLQRTAKLKKDSGVTDTKGYQELLAYLLSVVKPNKANATEAGPGA